MNEVGLKMDKNSSRASEGRLGRGDRRGVACSDCTSLVSWLSSASLMRSRASVGVVESILKAALLVRVASTGEKVAASLTGRGATSTRLSSVVLKLISERERETEKRKDVYG